MRYFWRDTKGATALEFALLAVPLLLFTIAIIELGRILFMQQSLSYAIDSAAREVHLQPQNTTELCNIIFSKLFLASQENFNCASASPSTTGIQELLIQVEYRFVSVLPDTLTNIFPLQQERIIIVDYRSNP